MGPGGTPAPEERPPLQLMGHGLWGCQGGVGVWGVCTQVLGCGEVSVAHTRGGGTQQKMAQSWEGAGLLSP